MRSAPLFAGRTVSRLLPTMSSIPGAGWLIQPLHPWLSNFRVVLRKGQLWFVNPEGDERALILAGAGVFQIGEMQTAEYLRLDTIVDGAAQRANVSGADYYRTFTP